MPPLEPSLDAFESSQVKSSQVKSGQVRSSQVAVDTFKSSQVESGRQVHATRAMTRSCCSARSDVAGIERAARAPAGARLGSIMMTCPIWQVIRIFSSSSRGEVK